MTRIFLPASWRHVSLEALFRCHLLFEDPVSGPLSGLSSFFGRLLLKWRETRERRLFGKGREAKARPVSSLVAISVPGGGRRCFWCVFYFYFFYSPRLLFLGLNMAFRRREAMFASFDGGQRKLSTRHNRLRVESIFASDTQTTEHAVDKREDQLVFDIINRENWGMGNQQLNKQTNKNNQSKSNFDNDIIQTGFGPLHFFCGICLSSPQMLWNCPSQKKEPNAKCLQKKCADIYWNQFITQQRCPENVFALFSILFNIIQHVNVKDKWMKYRSDDWVFNWTSDLKLDRQIVVHCNFFSIFGSWLK